MDDSRKVSAQIDLRKGEPIKISGNFEIIGIDGKRLTTDYTDEIYLCACGRSKIKPFCDGSHKG
jgi:CDGSH-type Zn-finger protein